MTLKILIKTTFPAWCVFRLFTEQDCIHTESASKIRSWKKIQCSTGYDRGVNAIDLSCITELRGQWRGSRSHWSAVGAGRSCRVLLSSSDWNDMNTYRTYISYEVKFIHMNFVLQVSVKLILYRRYQFKVVIQLTNGLVLSAVKVDCVAVWRDKLPRLTPPHSPRGY